MRFCAGFAIAVAGALPPHPRGISLRRLLANACRRHIAGNVRETKKKEQVYL